MKQRDFIVYSETFQEVDRVMKEGRKWAKENMGKDEHYVVEDLRDYGKRRFIYRFKIRSLSGDKGRTNK